MEVIDAHHHLWRYSPEEYPWIDDGMQALRRDFLLGALRAEMAAAGVAGTVAVQARQTAEETDWLLALAGEVDSPLCGVVGWLPLAAPDFPAQLEHYAGEPRLRALRHVLQAEAAGYMDRAEFRRGMAALGATGLAYDVLIYAHQLPEATRLVDAFPRQIFILDHLGKPNIRENGFASWSAGLRELARRPNVACKLSGMVTEADPARWTEQQLRPYAELALGAFGADRVMAGSDWPVLALGSSYAQWWTVVKGWLQQLSVREQALVLGGTAAHWYGLLTPAARPMTG